jgi:ABC-type uncharacterized transport system, ATPase component
MEKIIEINELRKRFKTHEHVDKGTWLAKLMRKSYYKKALDGLSFSVDQGDIVALLGRNGSGKSTLIKTMTGILHPDSGTVRVFGLDPWENRIRIASQIGVVLGAHGQLYWNLPAMDTFNFMKSIYHIPERDFRKRLNSLVDMLDLKKVYMRPVRTMSLGEQMKCNFVASVLHMPKIVFLDEPTIGVDLPSKTALRAMILTMRKEYQTTFIITTHLVEDITMAEKVILINKGKLIFNGSRDSLEHVFGDKRMIDLELRNQDKTVFRNYGKVIEHNDNFVKLEVNKNVLKSKRFIGLLAGDNVIDYKVYEPGLNFVLSKLYKKTDRKR